MLTKQRRTGKKLKRNKICSVNKQKKIKSSKTFLKSVNLVCGACKPNQTKPNQAKSSKKKLYFTILMIHGLA